MKHFAPAAGQFPLLHPDAIRRPEYRRRTNVAVPVVHTEPLEGFCVIEACRRIRRPNCGPPDPEPRHAPAVGVVKRRYGDFAGDAGRQGRRRSGRAVSRQLADGIWIVRRVSRGGEIRNIELMILQAARALSHTEYRLPELRPHAFTTSRNLAAVKSRVAPENLKDRRHGLHH